MHVIQVPTKESQPCGLMQLLSYMLWIIKLSMIFSLESETGFYKQQKPISFTISILYMCTVGIYHIKPKIIG